MISPLHMLALDSDVCPTSVTSPVAPLNTYTFLKSVRFPPGCTCCLLWHTPDHTDPHTWRFPEEFRLPYLSLLASDHTDHTLLPFYPLHSLRNSFTTAVPTVLAASLAATPPS